MNEFPGEVAAAVVRPVSGKNISRANPGLPPKVTAMETIDRMEQMIGDAYAPLRTALARLAECEEYLRPGLFDLLRKRSADLRDRLFIAQRDLARLCR